MRARAHKQFHHSLFVGPFRQLGAKQVCNEINFISWFLPEPLLLFSSLVLTVACRRFLDTRGEMTRFGGLCLRRPDMFWNVLGKWSLLGGSGSGLGPQHPAAMWYTTTKKKDKKKTDRRRKRIGLRELPVLLKVNEVIFDAKPLWVTVQLGKNQDSSHDKGLIQEPKVMDPDGNLTKSMAANGG